MLSSFDKQTLEEIIKLSTLEAQKIVRSYGNREILSAMKIENIQDFAFGACYALISHIFPEYFTKANNHKPNQEEMNEISQIIIQKLPEIRNSIRTTE